MVSTTFNLMGLFGWYKSSPINLTSEEISGRLNLGKDRLKQHNSLSFDAFLKASDNPITRQSDLTEMAESEVVRPIIDVYVEECTQPDINQGKVVWFECNDSTVEEDLNRMLETILIEDSTDPIIRLLAGCGNAFWRVLYNESGVTGFVHVENEQIERIYEPTTKRLLGFKWKGHTPSVPLYDDTSIFAPWEFIHFRNKRVGSEYGDGVLAHLYQTYRRILLGMNQMSLYRISTMPNRHVLMVDNGDADFTSGMEQTTMISDLLRQKQMISQQDFQVRYNTPALDSILVLPKRNGETTDFHTLTGDKDVPDVHDLEYLSKNLYGGARVPKAYLGHGDDSSSGLAQASLVSQDIRFARVIRTLRKPFVLGMYQLACIHLSITGRDPSKYDLKVKMSKISALEEEVNAATLEKQVNLAASLTSLCKDLEIPNREIIELVFREYLHVPRKFVDILKLAVKVQQALGGTDPSGSSGGMFSAMGGGMGDLGGGPGGGGDLDFGDGSSDITIDDAKLDGEEKKEPLLDSAIREIGKGMRSLNESDQEKVASNVTKVSMALSDLYQIGSIKKCSLIETIENNPSSFCEVIEVANSLPPISESSSGFSEDVHPAISMVKMVKKAKMAKKL